MYVGVCRVTLRLPGSASLKDKRQVIQSLSQRLRNNFGLAVAEVGENDLRQLALLGMTCVSNDARHARDILENAVRYIERARLDAEVLDTEMDVSPAF
jgi:uncharacterized protein YlxP (DUF503 family)